MLDLIDWIIIFAFFFISLLIGVIASRKAGKSYAEFFLSGRSMPWWLLGTSMVATTFSADTPNLVTDIVRRNGVAGNWVWWAYLLTGMLTVFVYAKLWRRSGIMTDLEFYELRYSGRAASFLRGFRALYLGVFFNVMIMASVSLAAIKIGGVLLGLTPVQVVVIGSVITVIYTSLGGLRGVILTDFFQFILAMIGMVAAAIVILRLPEIGGLSNLLSRPDVSVKTPFIPVFSDPAIYIPLFLMPLAVQWWSTWYPGAEPGGGGYIVQRVLAAKNEKHAAGATIFFNIAHYALRPWPWILIALCSIVVFPMDDQSVREMANATLQTEEMVAIAEKVNQNATDVPQEDVARYHALRIQSEGLTSLRKAFTPKQLPNDKLGHDVAFSAMLAHLPKGLIGLVIAALIAAFMSTISTHLNWGASYVVNDFYKRFIAPEANEKKLVLYGRIATVVLMALGAVFALLLTNALQAFNILLQIGAGTGLIFILRWFWWRINAYSEIAAMFISFAVAIYFQFIYQGEMPDYQRLVLGVVITTIGWIVVTIITPPDNIETLQRFVERIKPHGRGWIHITGKAPSQKGVSLTFELWNMLIGCIMVYGLLFSMGYFIYGQHIAGMAALVLALVSGYLLKRNWSRLEFQ